MECEFVVRTVDPDRLLDQLYESLDEDRLPGWEYDEDGWLYRITDMAVRFSVTAEQDGLRWAPAQLGDSVADRAAIAACLGALVSVLIDRFDRAIREIVVY